jgi:hypothetical protein
VRFQVFDWDHFIWVAVLHGTVQKINGLGVLGSSNASCETVNVILAFLGTSVPGADAWVVSGACIQLIGAVFGDAIVLSEGNE